MKSHIQTLIAGIIILGGIHVASAQTVVIAPEPTARRFLRAKVTARPTSDAG